MAFEKLSYLFLLLLIPIIFFVLEYRKLWINKKHLEFADNQFINKIFPKKKITITFILYSLFILFICLTLTNLQFGQKTTKIKQKTIDLVFAIDVSNSMNCEDVVPSRLEKAKKIIEKYTENTAYNKIGIVIFAGQAYSLSPLTNDYNAINQYVSTISTNMIDVQGTDLGLAIKESCGLLNYNKNTTKCIVLLSDGEDHNANENQGINYAKDINAKIISVGIGTLEGKNIPELDQDNQQVGFITDSEGNIVISKLQKNSIKKMANKTNGIYIENSDSKNIVQIIESSTKKMIDENNENYDLTSKENYFQYFLVFSLIVIFIISLTNLKSELNI